MAQLTTIANLKGDKGDQGDRGLPGPEAVPAATAVAAYISDADPDPDSNPVPAALNETITSSIQAADVPGQIATAITAIRDLASFVTLGDSRTMYNGTVTQADTTGDTITLLDRGYVTWAMVLLRQRMRWLRNGGVGGDTTAQMLARTPALLALAPGWVIGFGCINSVNAGVSATQIIDELGQIFDLCAAAGARVVWGTDWCSPGTDTDEKTAVVYQVNQWLRAQIGSRREFYLADYASVMVDPATGMPNTAYSSDQLHQDGPGGLRMARELVRVLEPLVPPSDALIVTNLDTTNLLTNGMFEGNGGTGRATSWSSGGAGDDATFAKIARTDQVPGEWQQVTCINTTAARLRQDIPADTSGSWVAGDTVYAELEFETDADAWDASEFNLGVQLFGLAAGVAFRAIDCVHAAGTPALDDRPEAGLMRTPAITIPAETTTVRVYVQLLGSGTYRVARARLARVVDPS